MSTITSIEINNKKMNAGKSDQEIVELLMPDYSKKISLNGKSSYTAPCNGWLIGASYHPDGTSYWRYIRIDGHPISTKVSPSTYHYLDVQTIINKNSIISINQTDPISWSFVSGLTFDDNIFFIPCKGENYHPSN